MAAGSAMRLLLLTRGLAASASAVERTLVVTRKQMTLEAADAVAQAAIDEAIARRFKDVSVAVVDATGRELGASAATACATAATRRSRDCHGCH